MIQHLLVLLVSGRVQQDGVAYRAMGAGGP
jgi:hypothetical protein